MVENEKSSYEAETPKSESTNAAETHTDKQEGLITKNSQNENSESESSLLLEKIKIKESVEAQIKTELGNLESDIKNQAFFEENEGKKTIKRDIIDKFLNQLAQKSSFGEIVALKHNTLRATAVQSKLESLGYNTGAIDGIYGKNTIKAVKAFQSANGLKIDGRAGNETLNKLLSTDAKKAETSNSEQNTDTNPGTKNTIEEANDNTQKEESSTTKQSTEIVNINGKIHKVHKTNNIQDIPQDGKRTEESVYEFAGYRFFNNGRALSQRTNNTYNSDSILKKLSDKNNTLKIGETVHESITAQTASEIPSTGKREGKSVISYQGNSFYNNGRVRLKDGSMQNSQELIKKLQALENTKTIDKTYHLNIRTNTYSILQELGLGYVQRRNELTASIRYQEKSFTIDISKYCDNRGNLTQSERLKNDLKKEKTKIEQLKLLENFLKEQNYTADQLFLGEERKIKDSEVSKLEDVKYTRFFNKFSNKTLIFDRDSKIDGNNLILPLDQMGWNEYTLTIPLHELGINSENYNFEKSIKHQDLKNNLRIALGKQVDKIVG